MPNIGMTPAYEPFKLSICTDYGIVLIFFFYGLKINTKKIKEGLHNWQMHLSIQSISFLLFPLLVLVFYPLVQTDTQYKIWLALFYLAALPSTVSSSVVMVSIAKGNLTGAIFNASLSGLIGIVATPLWMSLFLHHVSSDFNFNDTIVQLIVQILIPVLLGFLLHRIGNRWTERYKKQLARFDKTIILLIVYQSFSNSFSSGIFKNIGIGTLGIIGVMVLILFFTVLLISGKIASWLHFNREDRITLIFCASKKSLIHGSVMANVLFADAHHLGIFLLPIMVYHAFQLFYISIMAKRLGAEIPSA
jgi:solute carrier family 10 (sodium/bile acid cotransporter), member 7